MRRIRAFAFAAAVAVATPALCDSLPSALQVLGNVTNAARPVANALVIALNLSDFDAKQTFTATDGTFSLPPLRSGIYKIIAVKQGFLPSIATILPTRADHKLAIKLETEKQAGKRTNSQEIWEIRGSLPPDILREVDEALAAPQISYEVPRFRGEMTQLTGVAAAADAPAFAHTTLGVQSRLGDNWQLGFRGNLARVDDPTDGSRFGPPIASAQVMSMELRSSPTDAYRVASTRSSWRYTEDADVPGEAAVSAHNFEWEHGPSRVAVRYFEQDNLIAATPFGSNVLEIAGESTVLQTRRSDVGVSIRVTQETLHDASGTLRTADLSANGTLELVPAVILHYGMASRLGIDQHEWAPRTGAEWKVTKGTSFVGSAMVKVVDRSPNVVVPALVWTDEWRVLPKSVYTFGIVSGKNDNNRLSAILTVTEVDGPARMLLGENAEQFWDGLVLDSGDVRRDVRVACRRELGHSFAIDLSTSAGSAVQRDGTAHRKQYVTGDLQSTFTPTGTTLAISYREIQQPRGEGLTDYKSERVNVRMAQSLYLPIDVKLLIGVELARAVNSPFLVDALDGTGRKYIGGLALNF